MERLLDKIIEHNLDKEDRKLIYALIGNEKYHYAELETSKLYESEKIFGNMKKIAEAITRERKIEIIYKRNSDTENIKRKLCPLAIMFSEMYFYMVAIIENEDIKERLRLEGSSSPAIYRLDRISAVEVLNEKYYISDKDKFEAGKFKNRSKYMYGGNIKHITFEFIGKNVGMILDQIPTAEIKKKDGDTYLIRAEVVGSGIDDIWFKGLSDAVKIIPPQTGNKEA